MQKNLIIITALSLLQLQLFSQMEVKEGKPLFPVVNSFYDIGIDPAQLEMLRSLDQPKDQPFRFAIPSAVNLTPYNSGSIIRTGKETVWILGLTSKGAYSLNAIMNPFKMPEGGYMYIYNTDRSSVHGAFTNASAGNSGVLPVLPVPGDSIIIECHFPGKTIPPGSLAVSQVSHDFTGIFGRNHLKDENYGTSESCEVDVACSSDSKQLLSSRSVCRILIDGQYLCTGTLVNNTGSALKAYVLTANHCISTSAEALSSVFVFNYESPWCNGPDVDTRHSISGSTLKATNSGIDFTLLELSSFPSLVFNPYFAGWCIYDSAPSKTFVIHHPAGDVMKVSYDNDAPVSSSYLMKSSLLQYGFWKILTYDSGTTEAGSSGSALFDQDNYIRGTLTGGYADCYSPSDDYFAKISRMFDISVTPSANLRTWLDPVSTGATLCAGRDPYAYNLSLSDTLNNVPAGSTLKSDQLVSPGYGYSTGTNSDSLVKYAEYFDFSGTGEIAWVNIDLAKVIYYSSNDSVTISLYAGGSVPGAVIASKTFSLMDFRDNYIAKVDFDKTIPVSGPFYIGYSEKYRSPLSGLQSQFAVYHSQTLPDASLNTAWFNNGTSWIPFTSHPSFPAPVSLAISVVMVQNSNLNSIPDNPAQSFAMKVYPNPFSNTITFSTGISAGSTSLTIFDHSGNVVLFQHYENIFPGELPVELPMLIPGIYHYRIVNDALTFSGTIIRDK